MATADETMFNTRPVPDDFGDCKPLAHTDGPATSHEAVERHTESGGRATHCYTVYQLVHEHPHRTSRELYACLRIVLYCGEMGGRLGKTEPDIDLTELRRRLTDLKNQGRIVQGESRKCRVAGTRAVTWNSQVYQREQVNENEDHDGHTETGREVAKEKGAES